MPFRLSSVKRSLTNACAKESSIRDSSESRITDQLFDSLRVDLPTAEHIKGLKQGSPDWRSARKLRLTASNFGTAVGHNPWKSPDDLVEDMLFEQFKGNDATRWGNDKESIARNLYILKKRTSLSAQLNVSLSSVDFHVTESGLHVWDKYPWLAASPDGLVRENGEVGILEIKCPFSLKLYPKIPDYYMDQMQGIMGILGCSWCDFVVWTPSAMSIQRVPFDKKYWQEQLFPDLRDFYMNRFVPRYIANEKLVLDKINLTDNSEKISLRRWIDPSPPNVASGELRDDIQAQPLWLSEKGPLANLTGFDGFVSGVVEVNERLARNNLRLDYAGSSSNSMFLTLAAQLKRQGLLPSHYDTRTPNALDMRTDLLDKAAWQVRYDLFAHIAAHVLSFEAATGRSRDDILQRLSVLSGAAGAPGALELAAAAQFFKVHIICLIVSSKGVDERHFYPSLQLGPESLSAARGRVVVSSAGEFVWSSTPLSRSVPVDNGIRGGGNGRDRPADEAVPVAADPLREAAAGLAMQASSAVGPLLATEGDAPQGNSAGPAPRVDVPHDARVSAHKNQVRGVIIPQMRASPASPVASAAVYYLFGRWWMLLCCR